MLQEEDLAVAPLTITANRMNAVDFTVPFMSFKRVMIYRPSGQNFTSVSQALESGIKVGVIQGGSTSKALMTSSVNSVRQLWKSVENSGSYGQAENIEEGVERALQGNYGFITEFPLINKFIQQTSYELTTLELPLYEQFHGWAVSKGSALGDIVSKAILTLQTNGELDVMKAKWWPTKSD